MDKKIGFIGCGNMARAIISGLLNAEIIPPDSIIASNSSIGKLEEAKKDYGIGITANNREAAAFADILVLSVKPNKYKAVIEEVKNDIKEDVIIVSIAAGIKIKTIETLFCKSLKVVRTMPNISAVIGKAMTALCCNEQVEEEELKAVCDIFNSLGLVEIIDEELMDVATAISSVCPASIYMFIEALADGAVLKGLPRDKAYRMVAQTVSGMADMVLATGKHPGQLKDSVCSAGGITIEAVYSLEKECFRGHIMEAMQRCTEKSELLGAQINDKL